MNNEVLQQMQSRFDSLAQKLGDGTEFWYARDLQLLLGYSRWENFLTPIRRAVESCETAKFDSGDHFRGITKMVALGSGSKREIEDLMLTRYACYLIAQNGDPSKESIAFAQCYFAVQTRKLELIEDRMRLQDRFEITQSRPLADFLPTLTIAAKNLATEITNHNVYFEVYIPIGVYTTSLIYP